MLQTEYCSFGSALATLGGANASADIVLMSADALAPPKVSSALAGMVLAV